MRNQSNFVYVIVDRAQRIAAAADVYTSRNDCLFDFYTLHKSGPMLQLNEARNGSLKYHVSICLFFLLHIASFRIQCFACDSASLQNCNVICVLPSLIKKFETLAKQFRDERIINSSTIQALISSLNRCQFVARPPVKPVIF